MVRTWSVLVVLSIACIACRSATAVVLASDDFQAEGGGTGFLAADNWGNLAGGVSSTEVASPAFRALAPAIDAVDLASGSVFISFDFSVNQTVNWGGLAFFEGIDEGDETLFIGMPNGQNQYGIDLKGGQGTLLSGVPIDGQVRRIVAEIEFGSSDDTYRLWVDNLNQSMPNSQVMLDGFVVADPWQSVRVASDAGAGTYVTVDNLVIADSAADVGLIAPLDATLTIDRGTGEVSLSSSSSLPNVVGYTLRSLEGGFDQATWNPIDGRDATDATPPGDGTVDDDNWQVLTAADSTTDLSEFTFDITPGDGITLGTTALSLGTPWVRTPIQDVFATVTVDDNGTQVPVAVEVVYTGDAIASGDLDGDGDIDLTDWVAFKSGQGAVNGGMTAVEAYQMGDLDGNYVHDLNDFDLFAEAYDNFNGEGAFVAALSAVPEPSTIALFAISGVVVFAIRRRASILALLVAAAFMAVGISSPAHAVIYASDDFDAFGSGTGWAVGSSWNTRDDGGFLSTYPNGANDNTGGFRNFANPINPQNSLTYIRFDYRQVDGNGQNWGGFAFFEGVDTGPDESFFAGANPGNTDNYAFDIKGAGGGALDTGIAFDDEYHTIIGAIDQTSGDTVYSIWFDNFDVQNPDNTITIPGQGAINAPWQSLRFSGGGAHEIVDNLLITDGDEEAMIFETPELPALNLMVNRMSGEITIENNTGGDVDISAYTITSGSGMLDAGGTAGDFNVDGTVNIADYAVWRNNLGGDADTLGGNGSGGDTVTAADYDLWKENFGNAGGTMGGWESFAERDTPEAGFPQGGDNGLGWEEGANPSTFELTEYYLLDQSTVGTTPLSLGLAYGGGVEGNRDLVFTYRSNGELVDGIVYYTSGAAISASVVPEPSALAFVCIGATMVLLARRRC